MLVCFPTRGKKHKHVNKLRRVSQKRDQGNPFWYGHPANSLGPEKGSSPALRREEWARGRQLSCTEKRRSGERKSLFVGVGGIYSGQEILFFFFFLSFYLIAFEGRGKE